MNTHHDRKLGEEAAGWLLTLQDGDPRDHAEFVRWLLDSPRHVQEFLAITALDRAYEGMDPGKRLPVELNAATVVTPLQSDQPPAHRNRYARRPLWGMAAAVATLSVAATWWMLHSPSRGEHDFQTATGEQRAFELADGSVVHLNTHSRMRVRFSDKGRDIQLLAGEALFRVAPDKLRPFRVTAGPTVIQAIGTQFNVYRRATGDATVTVLEGKVRITDPETSAGDLPAIDLDAGKQLRISSGGDFSPVTFVNPVHATAWRQRRLMFHKDRLADITAEFNRYNESSPIRIADAALETVRLTGVFDADDPESLIQFLSADRTVRSERDGTGWVLRKGD